MPQKKVTRKNAPRNSAKTDKSEGLKGTGKERYLLRLYVSGSTPRSAIAIANIKQVCEERLKGRYELEVIDVLTSKTLVEDDVIAVPTLIKRLPLPLRKLIGDLSEKDKVLFGLDLTKEEG